MILPDPSGLLAPPVLPTQPGRLNLLALLDPPGRLVPLAQEQHLPGLSDRLAQLDRLALRVLADLEHLPRTALSGLAAAKHKLPREPDHCRIQPERYLRPAAGYMPLSSEPL